MRDEQRRISGQAEPGRPVPGPAEPAPSGDADAALSSLARLEALSRGEKPGAEATKAGRIPRPRHSSASRPAFTLTRIAAPVAFLVAVIVVASVAVQSGVVGGDADTKAEKPAPKASPSTKKSPKPAATKTKTGATRTYTVKPGDTLSGIAARFNVSVTEIEALNQDADLTTLQPGQKLTVPSQ